MVSKTTHYVFKPHVLENGLIYINTWKKPKAGENYCVFIEDGPNNEYHDKYFEIDAESVKDCSIREIEGSSMYAVPKNLLEEITDKKIISKLEASKNLLRKKYSPNRDKILNRQEIGEIKRKYWISNEDDIDSRNTVSLSAEEFDKYQKIEAIHLRLYKGISELFVLMKEHSSEVPKEITSLTSLMFGYTFCFKGNKKILETINKETESGGIEKIASASEYEKLRSSDNMITLSVRDYKTVKEYVKNLYEDGFVETLLSRISMINAELIADCFKKCIENLLKTGNDFCEMKKHRPLDF